MDFSLRCNSLKCRTQLTDYAVVTTCSHIYCIPCSEALGLGRSDGSTRICPACETQLPNPDDAVRTQLNPTEDYKTSVLSGFSPTVIMECAGRGLAFYSYQTAQEIIYQEFLARSLTEKYSTLSSQMDQIIHDANSEITNLRDKMKSMQLEQKSLEQRCEKLAGNCREKEKAKIQVQRLYTNLKQQHLAAGIEVAADHDAENVLEAAQYNTTGNRNGQQRAGRAGSNGSHGSGGRVNANNNVWPGRVEGSRAGLQSARSAPVTATPSGHRTRLPGPMYGNAHANNAMGGENAYQATPHRSALHNINPNVYGNSNNVGYGGLAAGVKVGRQQQGLISRSGYGSGRVTGVGGLNIR